MYNVVKVGNAFRTQGRFAPRSRPLSRQPPPTHRHLLQGWSQYFALRFPGKWQAAMLEETATTASGKPLRTDMPPPRRVVVDGVGDAKEKRTRPGDTEPPLVLHPSLVDGLSYPMSLIYQLRTMSIRGPKSGTLTILVLGATVKAGWSPPLAPFHPACASPPYLVKRRLVC